MPEEVKVVTKSCGYPPTHPAHNWRTPTQGSPGEMDNFVCPGGTRFDA